MFLCVLIHNCRCFSIFFALKLITRIQRFWRGVGGTTATELLRNWTVERRWSRSTAPLLFRFRVSRGRNFGRAYFGLWLVGCFVQFVRGVTFVAYFDCGFRCFDHSLSLLCFVVETITETLQPSYRRASSYTRLHGEKINTRLTVVVDGTRGKYPLKFLGPLLWTVASF